MMVQAYFAIGDVNYLISLKSDVLQQNLPNIYHKIYLEP